MGKSLASKKVAWVNFHAFLFSGTERGVAIYYFSEALKLSRLRAGYVAITNHDHLILWVFVFWISPLVQEEKPFFFPLR